MLILYREYTKNVILGSYLDNFFSVSVGVKINNRYYLILRISVNLIYGQLSTLNWTVL